MKVNNPDSFQQLKKMDEYEKSGVDYPNMGELGAIHWAWELEETIGNMPRPFYDASLEGWTLILFFKGIITPAQYLYISVAIFMKFISHWCIHGSPLGLLTHLHWKPVTRIGPMHPQVIFSAMPAKCSMQNSCTSDVSRKVAPNLPQRHCSQAIPCCLINYSSLWTCQQSFILWVHWACHVREKSLLA